MSSRLDLGGGGGKLFWKIFHVQFGNSYPDSYCGSLPFESIINYQLPVESSSGEYSVCAEHPSVVLCLSVDANSLDHLTQVDKVHELVLCICAA